MTRGTLQPQTVSLGRIADGMAPRIANLGEWRAHLLERLERQVNLTGDGALAALHEELLGYSGEPADERPAHYRGAGIVVPLRLRTDHGELAFFSTVTTFGTPVDITVSELAIESFFPADATTGEVVRSPLAG